MATPTSAVNRKRLKALTLPVSLHGRPFLYKEMTQYFKTEVPANIMKNLYLSKTNATTQYTDGSETVRSSSRSSQRENSLNGSESQIVHQLSLLNSMEI